MLTLLVFFSNFSTLPMAGERFYIFQRQLLAFTLHHKEHFSTLCAKLTKQKRRLSHKSFHMACTLRQWKVVIPMRFSRLLKHVLWYFFNKLVPPIFARAPFLASRQNPNKESQRSTKKVERISSGRLTLLVSPPGGGGGGGDIVPRFTSSYSGSHCFYAKLWTVVDQKPMVKKIWENMKNHWMVCPPPQNQIEEKKPSWSYQNYLPHFLRTLGVSRGQMCPVTSGRVNNCVRAEQRPHACLTTCGSGVRDVANARHYRRLQVLIPWWKRSR